jgi:hypothetical protein
VGMMQVHCAAPDASCEVMNHRPQQRVVVLSAAHMPARPRSSSQLCWCTCNHHVSIGNPSLSDKGGPLSSNSTVTTTDIHSWHKGLVSLST